MTNMPAGTLARAVLARSLAISALALSPLLAHAQSPADFYKGRNLDLMIGYSVGGGYDVYARMIARHLGKHIPADPTVVPKNMEGAGSLRLANWLYNVAAKDGGVLATIGRGTGFDPLLGHKAAQFDATKFNWIGSANDEVSVCVAWTARAKVKKFDDLAKTEITVGGTGSAADTDQFPRILNGVLGTKMKIITGYPGGNDVNLAMERGEVDGRCGWSWSSVKSTRASWLADKKITILMQLSLSKHPDLPDVPLVTDLATTEEQRQILRLIFARQVMGRPYLAPPSVPADRVAALRSAFMGTMADREFLAEAEKAQLEITPVSGEAVQKLVAEVYQTPPEIAKKAADLLK
jgi:tripartite-type tricarboxylate transporter receptor subunit TctC